MEKKIKYDFIGKPTLDTYSKKLFEDVARRAHQMQTIILEQTNNETLAKYLNELGKMSPEQIFHDIVKIFEENKSLKRRGEQTEVEIQKLEKIKEILGGDDEY